MPVDSDRSFARKPGDSSPAGPGFGLVIAAIVLVVWEILVRILQVHPAAFPSPTRVMLELFREAPLLARHAAFTGRTSLEGMLLAIAAGFPAAAALSFSRTADRIAGPVLLFLDRMPLVAFAPLMAVWFGFGAPPGIALSFLLCLLPVCAGCRIGFHSLPAETFATLQVMGARMRDVFMKALFPASLPYLAAAVKRAIPLALAGAVVAEFIGSDQGIGYLMLYDGSRTELTQLFAAMTVLVLMASLAHFIVLLMERVWISWPAGSPTFDAGPASGPASRNPR